MAFDSVMASVYPNSGRLHHRPARLSFGIKGKRRGQGRAVAVLFLVLVAIPNGNRFPLFLELFGTALGQRCLPRHEAVSASGLVALAEADRLVACRSRHANAPERAFAGYLGLDDVDIL